MAQRGKRKRNNGSAKQSIKYLLDHLSDKKFTLNPTYANSSSKIRI